jgi:hypothetical protein
MTNVMSRRVQTMSEQAMTTFAVGLLAAGISACQEPAASHWEAQAVSPDTRSELEAIANARVFFLHQSVGFNMLDGLRGLWGSTGQPGRIVQVDDGIPDGPAFIHTTGGRNGEPMAKIDAFAERLRSLEGLAPDLALMKLCYVDINQQTNIDQLLGYYQTTLEALEKEFPKVRFAHATVPLKTRSTSLKDRLYRTVGLEVWGDESNRARTRYNSRLRAAFSGAPIVDIARAESTQPDGRPLAYSREGESFYAMVPAYSTDGGHLNARGQRVVAEEMVHVLAKTLRAK